MKAELKITIAVDSDDPAAIREATGQLLGQVAESIRDGGVAGWGTNPPHGWNYDIKNSDPSDG